MLKDELKRIERLARINREKSLGKKGSELLDKPSAKRYIPNPDEKTESEKYEGADNLFNEMKQKPRYD